MRPSRRPALVAALVAALGVALLAPASAAPARPAAAAGDDLGSRVADAGDDLAGASRAVAAAARALAGTKQALPSARAAVVTATRAEATARAAAARASAAAVAADAAARLAAARAADLEVRIASFRDQIGSFARLVYIQGPYAELQAVLGAASPSEFAERLASVRSVAQSNNRTLVELRLARAELALRSAQAAARRAQAAAARSAAQRALAAAAASRDRAAAAQQRVAALVASRAAALAVAARERATVLAQYRALRAEQARVREQARRNSYRGPVSGSGLVWPIPGAGLSGGVGWRVHPVYGYRSCHTGVDVRGWYGTPIHVAAAGQVVSVESGGAYGLHTVVSHGGGLATMYAHQSRTTVHVGQTVAAGEVIGFVGSSGWVTGPHLHFEVHVGGVPYDPMGWFGSVSKHPVPCFSG